MGRKKQFLAKLLDHSGVFTLLAPIYGNNLTIFNYHRIRPDDPAFTTSFDDGVYGPTASDFFDQINWLRKNRTILSEEELIDSLKKGETEFRSCVLVTFDDGYRDNFTLAYPILKSLEVPAIFFIPTHLITARQLGWWDIIAFLIKQCKKPSISFEGVNFSLSEQKNEAIDFFTHKMKTEECTKTQNLLTGLSQVCEVEFPSLDLQDAQLMTWDQIRTVANDNISVGSHTHSHRVLSTLDLPTQREEMMMSKRILEHKLGFPIRSIAYPVGNRQHFTQQTQHIAQESNYELGFSFRTGRNENGNFTPFNIKRVNGPKKISMVPAISVFPKVFS